jgi:2-oxoglutarate dehydrogenase E2 component (dihydrolipoamide succinyltransferase)
MATAITMPSAGDSVVSGVLTAWTKDEGVYVERDTPVAEIETDKITVEILAPAAGALRRMAKVGDEIAVGASIGTVDESAAKPAAASVAPAAVPASAAAASAPAVTAAAAAPARAASATAAPVGGAAPAVGGNGSGGGHGEAWATPLAKKLAEDLHVDLGRVKGTGASGRIREQDVLAAAQGGGGAGAAQGGIGGGVSGGGTGAARTVTRERMSPLRQKIASRLVEAQHTAAMLTTFNECDMTAVMGLRKQYKEQFEKTQGIGLGFMSFFVKAVTNALARFPLVNASIVAGEDGKPAIEKHGYCDVAIAVSSPKGLVVPVIRDAQTLSFAGIERAIKDFGTRAKDGTLELSEMQGGTFTITNGGVFGSLMSTPILNPPQSAILGMHAIKNRAVEHPERPGEVAIRPMMYLALSYDHRIIDGAEAVSFLVSVKESIEDPRRLMLGV